MKTAIALCMALGMVGCSADQRKAIFINVATVCEWDSANQRYIYDNGHYNGSTKVSYSKVSCEYAEENWLNTPDTSTAHLQMERDRDPKTGILP